MKAISVVSVDDILKSRAIREWPVGRIKRAEEVSAHTSDMFVLWNSGGLSDALRKSAYNAWDTVEGVFSELAWELRAEER